MSRTDDCRVLGLPATATAAQIREAFLALSKIHHPDLHANDADATARYAKITAAYEALSKSPPTPPQGNGAAASWINFVRNQRPEPPPAQAVSLRFHTKNWTSRAVTFPDGLDLDTLRWKLTATTLTLLYREEVLTTIHIEEQPL